MSATVDLAPKPIELIEARGVSFAGSALLGREGHAGRSPNGLPETLGVLDLTHICLDLTGSGAAGFETPRPRLPPHLGVRAIALATIMRRTTS